MQVLKAFLFQICPDRAVEAQLHSCCWTARSAWNWTVAKCRDEYAAAVALAKEEDDFCMVPDCDPRGKPRKNEDGTPMMRQKWNAKSKSMDEGRLYRAFVDHHNCSAEVKRKHPTDHAYPWLLDTHCHVYNYPVRAVVTAYRSWWRETAKGRDFGKPKFKVWGKSRDSFSIQVQGKAAGSPERREQKKQLRTLIRDLNVSLRDKELPKEEREAILEKKKKITAEVDDLQVQICKESDQKKINARFFTDHRINIPGIGWVRCRRNPMERIGDAIPVRVTVSRTADRWYASISVSCEIEDPVIDATKPVIGVDLGVNALVTLSDGTSVDPPMYLERNLRRLKQLQRRFRRKQKGSLNYEKAKMRIARLHARIANMRLDFLHKLSHRLATGSKVVVVEGFDIQKLLKNVDRRARRRNISDAAWGELRRQLEYKCKWYGSDILVRGKLSPTDMECAMCGELNKMPPTTSKYRCSSCDWTTTRQQNTALLLKNFGEGTRPPEGTDGQSGTDAVEDVALSSHLEDDNQIQRSVNGSQPAPDGDLPVGSAGFLPADRKRKKTRKTKKTRKRSRPRKRKDAA